MPTVSSPFAAGSEKFCENVAFDHNYIYTPPGRADLYSFFVLSPIVSVHENLMTQ
jgi:hypothetical protein